MITIVIKYLAEVTLILGAIALFILGSLMIYESEGKLFYEPETVITAENADLTQKSHNDFAKVIHAFADELQAERTRLKAIGKLFNSIGIFLLILSVIQFGIAIKSYSKKRRSV